MEKNRQRSEHDSNNKFFDRRNNGRNYDNKKRKDFNRKLKYSFSTTSAVPEEQNQIQAEETESEVQTENLFDLDKIREYRGQTVSQDFLKLMKNQT